VSAKPSYRSKLKSIRLLLLDVDGVMTDGGVYYSEQGEEAKKFNVQDGYGIVALQKAGVAVGILTGRVSRIVQHRAEELGIKEVHQNLERKFDAYSALKTRLGLQDRNIAFVGDDLPDLPVLEAVGFSAAPQDAVDRVKRNVDYVCKRRGGEGAVREVIDLILANQARDGR
jgi:3-deoxy-D-manno-octulosonate 8-phosphate phosphatase (KDO 8-P phosphatase)